jgi:hypothetical protein
MPVIRLLGVATLAAAAAVASTPPSAHRTAPRAARVVTITARNFAFEAPDTVPAGRTELRLVNLGPELHHVYLMRLDGGHTPAELLGALKAGGPPPVWVHDAGGPNAPAPGQTNAAVLDLVPGTYVLTCFIPSPDGVPHIMKGMLRALTVVPASSVRAKATAAHAAAEPAPSITRAPDITMTLSDYAFALSRPLSAGKHVLHVRNVAVQPHEVFVVRLNPGVTVDAAAAWVDKQVGPPPMSPVGGTTPMANGASNDIALDLTPGEYALLCFMPDAKDGKPHIMHGMLKQVTVR